MKKPLAQACKEFAFATGSFYASSKAVTYAREQITTANTTVKAEHTIVGFQAVQGVLSIALYGCLSKFTTTGQQQQPGGTTGFRWLPSLSRSRPPMAISTALVAGCVALTFSPLVQVFHCMVCQPAIELFHSSSGLLKTSNDNKANNETPDAPWVFDTK